MTNQRRRAAKEKKRAARIRLRKARRLEVQQCDRLLFEAEIEWRAKRSDRAERLLEKVVRINPHHREAHLHLAELCFVTRRLEKGLRHFERVPVDEVPTPLVFYAADASLAAGEFDQGETLAREFLRRLGRGREAEPHRAAVKILIDQCRKARRAAVRAVRAVESGQADLFGRDSGAGEAPTGQTKRPPSDHEDRSAVIDGVKPAARVAPHPPSGEADAEVAHVVPLAIPALPEATIPPIPVQVDFDVGFLPWLHDQSATPSREALL